MDDNDKMDEFLPAAKAENKSVQGLLFTNISYDDIRGGSRQSQPARMELCATLAEGAS